MEKITVSLIKADVGGFPGHSTVHSKLMKKALELMESAKKEGWHVDYRVEVGDDLHLSIRLRKGANAGGFDELAWKRFEQSMKVLKNRVEKVIEIVKDRDKIWGERVSYISTIVALITAIAALIAAIMI